MIPFEELTKRTILNFSTGTKIGKVTNASEVLIRNRKKN